MNYRVASLLKRICEIRKERGIERAQQLRSISKFNPAWGLRNRNVRMVKIIGIQLIKRFQ